MRGRFCALLFLGVFAPFFASAATCPTLSLGSTGSSVTAVQKVLYDAYQGFPSPTGYFGSVTEAAVKQWQGEHNIEALGVVGPKTAAVMKINLCAAVSSKLTVAVSTPQTFSSVAGSAGSPQAALIQTLLAQIKILQDKIAVMSGRSVNTAISTTNTVSTSAGSGNGGSTSGGANSSGSGGISGGGTTVSQLASCMFNGASVASGQGVTAYQSASVPAGSQCVSEQRVCSNGVLSGSLSNPSCSVMAPTTRTVYARQAGAALNSNIDTGGGTDDTAALQAILDTAPRYTHLEVILDGVALISNTLVVHSNTTIRALPGAGVFVKNDSPSHILTSDMPYGARYPNTNITISGGVWNGNEMGQTQKGEEVSGRTYYYKVGFWFAGVDGLTLQGVTIRNAKTISLMIANSKNIVINNQVATWDRGGTSLAMPDQTDKYRADFTGTAQTPVGGYSWAGLEFWGNIDNMHVNGLDFNGDDDAIAFNTNEESWDNLPGGGKIGDGAIINVTIENARIHDGTSGIRFIGYPGHPGNTVDNIILRNISGNVRGIDMLFDHINAGHITIDGWYVTGKNAINLQSPLNDGSAVAHVTLNNIAPGTPMYLFPNSVKDGNYFTSPVQ